MNILIISNIRCGGFYLMKSLARTYGLQYKHEPKNIPNNVSQLVVKINVTASMMNETDLSSGEYRGTNEKWWIALSNRFDHTIILDRKPTLQHLQSIYYMYHVSKDMRLQWTWDIKDVDVSSRKWNKYLHNNIIVSERLKWISGVLNKEVCFYDDIYYKNKTGCLGELEFKPDLNEKLRKNIHK